MRNNQETHARDFSGSVTIAQVSNFALDQVEHKIKSMFPRLPRRCDERTSAPDVPLQ